MPQSSLYVGQKAAQTNYYADQQAERIGRPINVRVTINFSRLGIDPESATSVFRKLRAERFAPWMRRPIKGGGPAVPPTDHYGFENKAKDLVYREIGPGLPHNVHVHWSMHVPASRRRHFEIQIHSWIDEIAGNSDWHSDAIKIENLEFGFPAWYLNKGARKHIAKIYGANPKRICEQGLIIGKRTGTSRNIGPSCRRAEDVARGIDRRSNAYRRRPAPYPEPNGARP